MADTQHNVQVRTTVKDLASKELKSLGKTGEKAGKSIAGGFIKAQLSLGALKIAIRGLVRVMRSFTTAIADQNDALAKTAERIGVTIEELSVMKRVGELSRIRFETLARGIRNVSRNLFQLSKGSKEMALSFEAVGFSAEELSRLVTLGPLEAFDEIAAKLADVREPAKRTALAMRTLGEEAGPQLLPFINLGRQGMADLREEIIRLGGSVSTTQGRIAAAFNDSRTRISIAVDGIRSALSEEILPGLTVFLNKAATIIAENKEKIVKTVKEIAVGVGQAIFSVFKELAIQLARVADLIEELQKGDIVDVGKATGGFLARSAASVAELLGLAPKGLQEGVDLALQATAGAREQAVKDAIGSFETRFADVMRKFREGFGGGGAKPFDLSKATGLQAVRIDIEKFADVLDKRGPAMNLTLTQIQEAFERMRIGAPDKPDEMTLQRTFFTGLADAVAKIREQLQPEALGMTTVTTLTNAWSGFFDAITFGAQNAEDAFKNMARSMLQQLAQLANQALFAELVGLIGGSFEGAVNRPGGGSAGLSLRTSTAMRNDFAAIRAGGLN